MTSKRRSKVAAVRISTLIAAILTIIIGVISCGKGIDGFNDRITLKTRLPEANGLKPSSAVRVSGVYVGQVKEVRFAEIPRDNESRSNTIEVVIEVDSQIARDAIRSDSNISIEDVGALGEKVVNISPGTAEGQPVKDGDYLPNAKEMSIQDIVYQSKRFTANYNIIMDTLGQIDQQIKSGRGSAGRFLYDEQFYVNLKAATTEAEELMRRLEQGDGSIARFTQNKKLMADLRDALNRTSNLADQIRQGQGSFGKFLNQTELSSRLSKIDSRYDSISKRIDGIAKSVNRGDGSLGKFTNDKQFKHEVDQLIASFNRLAERLQRSEGTLGLLLNDNRLSENLSVIMAELTRLAYDIQENPKKYIKVKFSLF